MSEKASFFTELKRRNVLRAAAIYAAAVWALAQGIAQLTPVVSAPDWVARWFLVAAAIGFPFWVAFAWFYEFTPSGLKRESEIAPDDSIAHSTGRKLDFWIIGILALAVVLLLTDRFVVRHGSASTAIPEKSVAVLPLANESGDPKQQYFSDGLSEELISDLTQITALKVIGKYSSFQFRDSKESMAQIGAALGVAHLIEGSVFQQGDRIRVIVSLIRTADGSSLWSHTYDEALKDVFAIQSHIGQAVATELKIKLFGQAIVAEDKPPSGDVEAYRLMLQGRALVRHDTPGEIRQGIALYQQALALDPDYAYAWGSLGIAWINLGRSFLTGDARQQAYTQARAAADKQLTLAPDSAITHADRGYLLAMVDDDHLGALAEYKRAYALAPNDGTIMGYLALGLADVGQLQPAIDLLHKAIATDPLRTGWHAMLGNILLDQGQLDAAEQAIHKAMSLQPDRPWLNIKLAFIDMARGQLDAAEQAVRREMSLHPNPDHYGSLARIDILRGDAAAALRDASQQTDLWVMAAAKQIAPDRGQADAALQDFLAKNGKTNPYDVALLYAIRKQPDEMFDWLQRAVTEHDLELFLDLLNDPLVLAYQHDPRFAAICHQAGLPIPGQLVPAPR